VSWLLALGRFILEFVIGDDWRVAAGIVLAIALTAALATTSIAAWWILPVAVAGLLALTLARELRGR
jgi:hypothetical protein